MDCPRRLTAGSWGSERGDLRAGSFVPRPDQPKEGRTSAHFSPRTFGRAHAQHLSRGLEHPNGAHPGMTTPPFACQGLAPWPRNGPLPRGFDTQKIQYAQPLCPCTHPDPATHTPTHSPPTNSVAKPRARGHRRLSQGPAARQHHRRQPQPLEEEDQKEAAPPPPAAMEVHNGGHDAVAQPPLPPAVRFPPLTRRFPPIPPAFQPRDEAPATPLPFLRSDLMALSAAMPSVVAGPRGYTLSSEAIQKSPLPMLFLKNGPDNDEKEKLYRRNVVNRLAPPAIKGTLAIQVNLMQEWVDLGGGWVGGVTCVMSGTTGLSVSLPCLCAAPIHSLNDSPLPFSPPPSLHSSY